MKTKSIHDDKWKVAWRPGQQDWLMSNKVITYGEYAAMHRCNYTIIGCSDGIVVCRMYHRFYDSVVIKNDIQVYTLSSQCLSRMKPADFTHWLMYHCYYMSSRYTLRIGSKFTVREAARQMLLEYLHVYRGFGFNQHKTLPGPCIEERTDDLLENCGIQDVTLKMDSKVSNELVCDMQTEALDMAAHMMDHDAEESIDEV